MKLNVELAHSSYSSTFLVIAEWKRERFFIGLIPMGWVRVSIPHVGVEFSHFLDTSDKTKAHY